MLQFMGSQRVRHDWATEMNWTELKVNWQPIGFNEKKYAQQIVLGQMNINLQKNEVHFI